MRKLLILLAAIFFLSGFALPSAAKTYLFDIYVNPEIDFKSLRRFMLYEEELEDKDAIVLAEILQGIKEVLFRKGYECGGKTGVKESDIVDFVVSAKFSLREEYVYVPPKTVLLPYFIPGRTYSTFGSVHSFQGGCYHFNARTTESGRWTSVPFTLPGEYKKFHIPVVTVQIYSYRNGPLLLFEGSAYKLLKEVKKPQETLKSIAKDLMEEFPTRKSEAEKPKRKKKR